MRNLLKLILAAVMLAAVPCVAADTPVETGSYWIDHSRGWFWYEDPILDDEKPKEEKPAEKPKVVEKPKRIQDMKNAAEVRAEVQRLLDLSAANPTKANVTAYMEANKYVLDKAGEFADVWRRVLWETPSLDHTVSNPVTAIAMTQKKTLDSATRARNIADLSKEYGLFFFFKSDCPYCHTFAPILNRFASGYGMEIFPISLDGGGLPDYPRPRPNNGMAERLNVTTVPAVFLGNKKTGEVMPVGYGVMSEQELLERIYVVTQTKPGENLQ